MVTDLPLLRSGLPVDIPREPHLALAENPARWAFELDDIASTVSETVQPARSRDCEPHDRLGLEPRAPANGIGGGLDNSTSHISPARRLATEPLCANNAVKMSENIGSVRTLKRKNVKGLALAAPAPRTVAPSESDLQIPGGVGTETARQTAQLEIGIEYKLDLKREDLEVLRDLGHGNGGTVSKVRHMATGTVMARKVALPPIPGESCAPTN